MGVCVLRGTCRSARLRHGMIHALWRVALPAPHATRSARKARFPETRARTSCYPDPVLGLRVITPSPGLVCPQVPLAAGGASKLPGGSAPAIKEAATSATSAVEDAYRAGAVVPAPGEGFVDARSVRNSLAEELRERNRELVEAAWQSLE